MLLLCPSLQFLAPCANVAVLTIPARTRPSDTRSHTVDERNAVLCPNIHGDQQLSPTLCHELLDVAWTQGFCSGCG